MRLLWLLATAAALTSCERSSSAFGGSYDECLLINGSQSQGPATVQVEGACRRHFETVGSLANAASATANLTANGYGKGYDFTVTNNDRQHILTGVDVTVTYTNDKGENAASFRWSFSTFIAPDEQAEMRGSLSDAEPPPGPYSVGALVTRYVTISRQPAQR